MATAIGPTADWLLRNQPFQVSNPFGPGGITDMTRQGWFTGLQGIGSQFGPAQQFAQNMTGLQQLGQGAFLQGLGSGAFQSNPWMQQAAQQAVDAPNQPGFGFGMDMLRQAPNQPGFGNAANLVSNTQSQFGGGWSGDLAGNINRTGASFDPYNNPALGEAVSEANRRLGRDFREGTMRELNQAAAGAGPGAYGGTRAGVAQGIAERGLADAMQRQTTDMLSRGYEAGLGRYVQDRGQTLDATLRALQQGSATGLRGAEILGNLAGRQGDLQLGAGRGLGDIAGTQGGLGMQGANALSSLGLGALGQQNNMFQFGFGQMLPSMMQQAYNAQRQPGQIMQDMGNMMTGIGGAQQMQNQATIDWMNSHAAQRQNWPWEQFARYQSAVGPIVNTPGQQVTSTQQGPGMNPWQAGVGGALTGMGLWNQWQQMQNPAASWGGNTPMHNPNPGQLP